MAKRKVATRSDGRRAPSGSASRRGLGAQGPGPGRPAKTGQPGRESTDRTPDEEAPSPAVPSSLDMDRRPSAARSGRAGLQERYREHHETGPGLTAGDVDADWQSAYSVGDEAPGGDNPTPGQTVVEDVGRALGVEYADGEELKAAEKIETRDRHRWELDPASSEDYPERTRAGRPRRVK
jgi:hypothetical protein